MGGKHFTTADCNCDVHVFLNFSAVKERCVVLAFLANH